MKNYRPLRVLCENGWEWMSEDDHIDYYVYKAHFCVTYTTTISAIVSENSNHLDHHGCYGVMWIEAEYECDHPYSSEDLKDMLDAIDLAEKNLLLIGMPFSPDYKFQSNQANRIRRNKKLRKMYNLDELEKQDKEQLILRKSQCRSLKESND